jgi:hypothetical protein
MMPTVLSPGNTIAVDLATSEAITSQNNEFITVGDPEATQAVRATQQKKRGRPRGSRDKQPRKKRAIVRLGTV